MSLNVKPDCINLRSGTYRAEKNVTGQKPLVFKLYSLSKTRIFQQGMVSRIGFEPMTPSLKGKCSTN